ncbi:MAG: class I SAM-dependent methyltransferase [Microgenomates group bacterium]|jgi:SAM-dependent methyltransferase
MHPTYNYIFHLINEFLSNDRKVSLVDYGCGNGLFLEYFPKGRILKYLGLDINLSSIDFANKNYRSKKISFGLIRQGYPAKLGKPNSIDLIVLIGVLQYMSQKEIDLFLKEARKVLRKDGRVIISCAVDHVPYRIFNIYRLLLPNYFINEEIFLSTVKKSDMKIIYKSEKGIFFAPLFSNVISLFFDISDKIIFQTKGSLGPIGRFGRAMVNPILRLEYSLPINYGYTLFFVLKK